MIKAEEARKQTVTDFEWADVIEENICTKIKDAAEKGMNHVGAWVYDRHDKKWLGDIPDAVIEELEWRFIEAGYKLKWQGKNSYIERVIEW